MNAESSATVWIVQDEENGRILGVLDNQEEASDLAEKRNGIYASYLIGFGVSPSSGEHQF